MRLRSSDHRQRRYWRWIIAGVMLFFIACHRSSDSLEYTFLFLPRNQQSVFHAALAAGAKAAAREQHITLLTHNAPFEEDYAVQDQYLREVLVQPSVDGVIITPAHSAKLLPILQQLDHHGIPFIVVDTPLEGSDLSAFTRYCGYIGTDNQRGGGLAASYIGETIKSGRVLLVRGVMSHRTSQDSEIGFLNAIKRYPKITVADIVEGKWTDEGAQAALRTKPQDELATIDAVFAYNDLMALGVSETLQAYQLRPLIVGYDGLLEAQSAILAGDLDATVTQDPETMGRKAVEALRACIANRQYLGTTTLTHVTLLKAARTLTAVSSYEHE